MDISNAVGLERISQVVGYKITKGDFRNSTPNLPQRIAVIGEANTANQVGLVTTPVVVNSAHQAGVLFGFGSPIYHMVRILKPLNSEGVGGIPVVVYAQSSPVSTTSQTLPVTVTGTATANATHKMYVNGRAGMDGQSYDIIIVKGDTPTIIAQKIETAINSVIGCPASALVGGSGGLVTLTSKWKGSTSAAMNVSFDNQGVGAGVTYAIAAGTAGTGVPDFSASLALFGNDWNTIVVNGYTLDNISRKLLEDYNGVPNPIMPTGRYAGIVMKPFVAVTGTLLDNPTTLSFDSKSQCTIAFAPAPLSKGFEFEAAANMTVLYARVSQDTPHLDVQGLSYPDMPAPASIGTMATYDNRDYYVKNGCSTVELVDGKYRVVDFVTTYHPDGEIPPQFRYCRNLMLDFNVRFGYYILEQSNVLGHALADDSSIVTAAKVLKPKQWKAILRNYALDLANRGLIADPTFMQNSIEVQISPTNPDRLNTFFRYKRTGYLRISSTTAEAGFYFGN